MSVTLEVVGTEQAQKALKGAQKGIVKGIGQAMRTVSLFMEGEVKQSIAGRRAETRSVDTGRFMNSVKGENTQDTAVISTNVPYAQHLEYGTSRVRARRHFNNSLDRNRKKIKEYIKADIKVS